MVKKKQIFQQTDLDALQKLFQKLVDYQADQLSNDDWSQGGNALSVTAYQFFCQTTAEQPKGTVFDVKNGHCSVFSVQCNGCITSKTGLMNVPYAEFSLSGLKPYFQRIIRSMERTIAELKLLLTTDETVKETANKTTKTVQETLAVKTEKRFFGYDTQFADEQKLKRLIENSVDEFNLNDG